MPFASLRTLRYFLTCASIAGGVGVATNATAAVVPVSDVDGLKAAIANAKPGDEITLAAGTYDMPNKLSCSADGSAGAPITVRAAKLGEAMLKMGTGLVEGFLVSGTHWHFENLDIEGTCSDHSKCEHAFHIVGNAEFAVLKGNRVKNFNAQIKSNGTGSPSSAWPDDVLIEGNEFFNESARATSNPVTPIDVVGGRRWVVRANYIHDFAKGAGNNVSYAAFLKGNSRDGLFERNLIVCEKLHSGQVRLGLSFGGGGTGTSFCEDGTCATEHQNGIMRNNLIAHCPADVGIYLNKAQNTRLFNNTLFNTTGIDFRFGTTTGEARNNILAGKIRNRDGASHSPGNNLSDVTAQNFNAWFSDPDNLDFGLKDGAQLVDKGANLAEVTDDYCGNDRDDGTHDIGAVEYDGDGPCDTSVVHIGNGSGPGAGGGGNGSGQAGGSAVGGASSQGGAGSASNGDATSEEDGGCGCRVVGIKATSSKWHAGWLAGLLVLGWRRGYRALSTRC